MKGLALAGVPEGADARVVVAVPAGIVLGVASVSGEVVLGAWLVGAWAVGA